MCFKSEKMYKLISNIWRNNSIKSENTKISYIKRENPDCYLNANSSTVIRVHFASILLSQALSLVWRYSLFRLTCVCLRST